MTEIEIQKELILLREDIQFLKACIEYPYKKPATRWRVVFFILLGTIAICSLIAAVFTSSVADDVSLIQNQLNSWEVID